MMAKTYIKVRCFPFFHDLYRMLLLRMRFHLTWRKILSQSRLCQMPGVPYTGRFFPYRHQHSPNQLTKKQKKNDNDNEFILSAFRLIFNSTTSNELIISRSPHAYKNIKFHHEPSTQNTARHQNNLIFHFEFILTVFLLPFRFLSFFLSLFFCVAYFSRRSFLSCCFSSHITWLQDKLSTISIGQSVPHVTARVTSWLWSSDVKWLTRHSWKD